MHELILVIAVIAWIVRGVAKIFQNAAKRQAQLKAQAAAATPYGPPRTIAPPAPVADASVYGQRPLTPEQYGQQPLTPEVYGSRPLTPEQYGQQPLTAEQYGRQALPQEQYGRQPQTPEQYGRQPTPQFGAGPNPQYPSPYGQPPTPYGVPQYGQPPASYNAPQYGQPPYPMSPPPYAVAEAAPVRRIPAAPPIRPPASPTPTAAAPKRKVSLPIGNPNSLLSAVVMQEILGPPVSKRASGRRAR